MPHPINLNADLGESYGAWVMGNDPEMLPLVGSANLACGFHGGDPLVMRQTLRLARQHGVSVGAHPSYPDLQGFGRRPMTMAPDELEAAILYQIAALDGMARTEGLRVAHVKPHGALSNAACADRRLADTVARAIRAYDPTMILLAPALSPLCAAGRAAGLPVVEEIFADRAYQDDGQLVPRSRPGAMVHGAEASYAHVRRMLDAGGLISVSGQRLPCRIGSICIHGDGADAVATARHLRERLLADGHALVALPQLTPLDAPSPPAGPAPVQIRPATEVDLPALCGLLSVLFTQEADFAPNAQAQHRGLLRILRDPAVGQVLLAEAGAAVLGMANLLFTVSTALGARVALLEDVVVAPGARGAGIGTHLLHAAVAHARAQGCQRLTLLTDADNLAAQRWYQRHGFTRSGMVPLRLPLV